MNIKEPESLYWNEFVKFQWVLIYSSSTEQEELNGAEWYSDWNEPVHEFGEAAG